MFRPHTGTGVGFGGASSNLQALSQAAVEAVSQAQANASARAAAAAAADPKTPGGGAADSVDIADAASAAAAAPAPSTGGAARPHVALRLPSPALPSELIGFAAAYSAKVDDLTGDPLPVLRKAGAPPSTSFELTPTTKLAFAPAVHAQAFEVADAKGWFGSSKLVLRAVTQDDLVDWMAAINASVDAASLA